MATTKNLRLKKPKASEKIKAWVTDRLKVDANYSDIETCRQMLRGRCKEDLWFLCYHVVEYEDICTPLHFNMCERWTKRSSHQYSLWLIPRGHLKTSLWTVGGCLQELLRDADQRILLVNAKLDNAEAILNDIRNICETKEIFRWLFPEYCPDLATKEVRNRCKWGVSRLDFPCSKYAGRKEGNIEIMGVEASLVSRHYDLFVFDDPVNDVNSATKAYRDKVNKWYKNALQLRDSPKSRVRLIGTRWHFDDLYSRIIKKEMSRRRRQKENGEKLKPRYLIYHRQVVEKVYEGGEEIVGKSGVLPIWPERYSVEDVQDIRDEVGSYIFSCQFMNNPLPEEDAVFKLSDINVVDYYDIPEEEKLVNFMSVDMAVDETEKGDYTVLTVASFDDLGRMYVRQILRAKMLPSDILDNIGILNKKWQCKRVGIETTAFQKMLYKVYKTWAIQRGFNIPWKEMERGKTSKVKRILALQPRTERGDFYVEENIKNIEELIEEMTTFPRSIHDDILDTLADIEQLSFSSPEDFVERKAVDTWDAVYGTLEELEEIDEDEQLLGCGVIGEDSW